MSNENTDTSRDVILVDPTLNNNNTNSEEISNEKQRAEWTYDRDLIYMKGMVECYPPAQGHGSVTKAWKDIQAAVNSIDQNQGQLKTTTLKCRGGVLIEEYKQRKLRQQQSTGSGGDYTSLDQWISKYITMLQGIEKKGKAKRKGKERMEKSPDDTSLAESSTAEKRPASDVDENAKRAKVVPEIPIIHNLTEDSALDQNTKLTLLQQLARQTEAVKDVQKTMITMNKTLENGFQSLNATLNRLANAMAKPAPPPSRRPFVPVPIQKKTDNNNNQ